MVRRWQHDETGMVKTCNDKPGDRWFEIDELFEVGDLVTRDGTDWQFVAEITEDGFSGVFVCVKSSELGWCNLGDVESNLARRYSKVETL